MYVYTYIRKKYANDDFYAKRYKNTWNEKTYSPSTLNSLTNPILTSRFSIERKFTIFKIIPSELRYKIQCTYFNKLFEWPFCFKSPSEWKMKFCIASSFLEVSFACLNFFYIVFAKENASNANNEINTVQRKWLTHLFLEAEMNFDIDPAASSQCYRDFSLYKEHLKAQSGWAVRSKCHFNWINRLIIF